MKKIITILILLLISLTILGQQPMSEDPSPNLEFKDISLRAFSSTPYLELNGGFASFNNTSIYPGGSFLLGSTIKFYGRFLIDVEGGIAFPTVLTAKLGLGFSVDGENGTLNVISGIRPYPFTLYIQSTVVNKKNGQWIVSVESGRESLGFGFEDGWNTRLLINFGRRFNIR
tara:strand:- start:11573 stop:12088 length:516 start_codon:yes stop_codon:yes gene_type:complete